MIRINLLPHRAEKRRARQIQFAALAVISLLLGALVVGFVHATISSQISYQERRNEYLKQETAILDKQIAEIRNYASKPNPYWHAKMWWKICKAHAPMWCTCWIKYCISCRMRYISDHLGRQAIKFTSPELPNPMRVFPR